MSTIDKGKEKDIPQPEDIETPTRALEGFVNLRIDSSEGTRVERELALPPTVFKLLADLVTYGESSSFQPPEALLFDQIIKRIGSPKRTEKPVEGATYATMSEDIKMGRMAPLAHPQPQPHP